MKVEIFPLGALMTNAYLVYDESLKRGVVFDPGYQPQTLIDRIHKRSLTIEAILLTHAHADHIGGLSQIRSATGAPVYIHSLEQDWLMDASKNGSGVWPGMDPVTCEPAEYILEGNEELTLFGQSFTLFHTPGHSPGSLSYLSSVGVFSGDVLFRRGVGRTDLYQGDAQALQDSIVYELFPLANQTVVYPGHGPHTTIGEEKELNPYVEGS